MVRAPRGMPGRAAVRCVGRGVRPGRTTPWVALAVWLAPTLCAATPNTADPPRPEARAIVAFLLPQHQEMSVRPAFDAFLEPLIGQPVDVRVEPLARLDGGLAVQWAHAREAAARTGAELVVWLDLAHPAEPLLVVTDGSGARLIARTLHAAGQPAEPAAAAPPDTARLRPLLAAAGLAVQAQVRALLAARAAGRPPDDPLARPMQPAARPCWLSVELGYALDLLAPQLRAQHGLGIGLIARPHRFVAIGLGYRFLPTVRIAGTPESLWLQRHPLQLDAAFVWPFAERFRLRAAAGLSLSLFAPHHDALPRGWTAAGVGLRAIPGALAELALDVRLIGRLGLVLAAGVDVPLVDFAFAFTRPGERNVLLDPWPAQFRTRLGVALDLP